jgi:diacylglycerol kinase (ATP)
MENSPLLLIVNPGSGKEEPILELIGKVFYDSGIKLDIHVLDEDDDPAEIAGSAADKYRLIAAYGGDGSITKVAAGLTGRDVPMAIIPGGTANVLSKELDIPQDSESALRLIRDGDFEVRHIDTGLVNGEPFFLRVNLGLMADMIIRADTSLKDKVGQLAYGVSAFESWQNAQPTDYELIIDGERHNVSGVTLTITNSGSMGIGALQLAQDIRIDDGLLDVILLKEAGLGAVAGAVGSTLFGKESEAIFHRTCRTVDVLLNSAQGCILDDCEDNVSSLSISIVPSSLTVVVPKKN